MVLCGKIDGYIGMYFDWAIKQMPSEGERVSKSEYVVNQVDADFIVIGSSRAEAHYNSQIIKDAFPQYSVFNCGVDGQLFYYITTAFNSIIDRYTPKVVVWDFQLKDLVDETEENLSLLYPYYYSNYRVRELLDIQDPSLKFMLRSNCYRFNGTASRILRAMRMKETGKLGFLSHVSADVSRKFEVKDISYENQLLVPRKVELLIATIKRAQDKGIKLILCVSPEYNRLVGQCETVNMLHQISKDFNIQFIDCSQMEQFIHADENWYDTGHLNALGADKFTRDLVKKIQDKH